MLKLNNNFEEAVNCMELSNAIKKECNNEDGDLIRAVLLNFYGINLNGL